MCSIRDREGARRLAGQRTNERPARIGDQGELFPNAARVECAKSGQIAPVTVFIDAPPDLPHTPAGVALARAQHNNRP